MSLAPSCRIWRLVYGVSEFIGPGTFLGDWVRLGMNKKEKNPIFVVAFSIASNDGLEGHASVWAQSPKEARELFTKKIRALDPALKAIDIKRFIIEGIYSLEEFETYSEDKLEKEHLPGPNDVVLFDLGD